MRWLRRRASARGVVLLATAFIVQATSGCLSNEYRIQKDELRRLAQLPPDARGASVRVSQQLGDRRAYAVEPSPAQLDEDEGQVRQDDRQDVGQDDRQDDRQGVQQDFDLNGDVNIGDPCCRPSRGPGPGRLPSGGFRGPPTQGFRGPPAPSGSSGGSPGGSWRAPGGGSASASGGFRSAPASGGFHGAPPSSPSSSNVMGSLSGGGGGGGGNGADALVLVAVIVIVGAAIATVILAASEGMRYEGHVRLAPDQVVHLERSMGGIDVRLSDLTPDDVARSDSALVMDDEGWGLLRLDHAPLDRRGPLFRFELGAGVLTLGDARAVAVMSRVQAGVFFTRKLGLVVDLGLGSGSVQSTCCLGSAVDGASLTRVSLGLEAEALPLTLGPVHVGGFLGGGVALVGGGDNWQSGPTMSAGPLLELDLTSHLALTLRGGASASDLPGGWSTAAQATAGLTIY